MRKMTEAKMREVTGGKRKRYVCSCCRKKSLTWVGAMLHSFNHYRKAEIFCEWS